MQKVRLGEKEDFVAVQRPESSTRSVDDLVALALKLGAKEVGLGLTAQEREDVALRLKAASAAKSKAEKLYTTLRDILNANLQQARWTSVVHAGEVVVEGKPASSSFEVSALAVAQYVLRKYPRDTPEEVAAFREVFDSIFTVRKAEAERHLGAKALADECGGRMVPSETLTVSLKK